MKINTFEEHPDRTLAKIQQQVAGAFSVENFPEVLV